MKCPSCHAESVEGDLTCKGCGMPLAGDQDPTVLEKSDDRHKDSAPPKHGQFQPGQKISDRYRIVSLLGRGGMGEVYRADDLELGQSVALKFLSPRISSDPLALDRFRKEVRTARDVTHPNVCRIHDIGEADGRFFLSMEYVDGEDLSTLLKRMGRPTQEKSLALTRQIALGLAAVHDVGVIHRDLKPSNIMVDGRGNVRLMDFGIASLQEDPKNKSGTAGTPVYMAPELFQGEAASVQSDIYALGLVLYEIFTGHKAYQGDDARQLLQTSEGTTPTSPSSLVMDMDPLVERAIFKCLEIDPKQRPASAYGLMAFLPGGDPLAAAVAAGQTPSPEMVAAAGDEGGICNVTARNMLITVILSLVAVCWLAHYTYEVNQVSGLKHPEVLEERVRELLDGWDYDLDGINSASGFEHDSDKVLKFWYRQRPDSIPFLGEKFYHSWGKLSYGRASPRNPPWGAPGELMVVMDLKGQLELLRVLHGGSTNKFGDLNDELWERFFPTELIGYELSSLDKEKIKELPPLDPYDQISVWRATQPGTTNLVYLQAAAYRGRPVYFRKITPELMEKGLVAAFSASSELQTARNMIVTLYLVILIGAAILAWRNYRRGQSDRRGSFRVAFALFVLGLLAWLFLTKHQPKMEYELALTEIGLAQALLRAGVFWLFYVAVEPFVRKLWPQTLIGWTRLIEGRWRDPLLGRDLLLGLLLGIVFTFLHQVGVVAAGWIDSLPQVFIPANPTSLKGAFSLLGYSMAATVDSVWKSLFSLLFILVLRLIFKRMIFAGTGYLLVMVPISVLSSVQPMMLALILQLTTILVFLWVLIRFGYLPVVVWMITTTVLRGPITLDFSAWYAAHGMIAPLVLAGLAVVGYYFSQGKNKWPLKLGA